MVCRPSCVCLQIETGHSCSAHTGTISTLLQCWSTWQSSKTRYHYVVGDCAGGWLNWHGLQEMWKGGYSTTKLWKPTLVVVRLCVTLVRSGVRHVSSVIVHLDLHSYLFKIKAVQSFQRHHTSLSCTIVFGRGFVSDQKFGASEEAPSCGLGMLFIHETLGRLEGELLVTKDFFFCVLLTQRLPHNGARSRGIRSGRQKDLVSVVDP